MIFTACVACKNQFQNVVVTVLITCYCVTLIVVILKLDVVTPINLKKKNEMMYVGQIVLKKWYVVLKLNKTVIYLTYLHGDFCDSLQTRASFL